MGEGVEVDERMGRENGEERVRSRYFKTERDRKDKRRRCGSELACVRAWPSYLKGVTTGVQIIDPKITENYKIKPDIPRDGSLLQVASSCKKTGAA
jgi:hypothetical protein